MKVYAYSFFDLTEGRMISGLMEPLTDVDGGVWIPVNADALHELVKKYIELKEGRNDKC